MILSPPHLKTLFHLQYYADDTQLYVSGMIPHLKMNQTIARILTLACHGLSFQLIYNSGFDSNYLSGA